MVIKINLRDKFTHCFLFYTKKYKQIYAKKVIPIQQFPIWTKIIDNEAFTKMSLLM